MYPVTVTNDPVSAAAACADRIAAAARSAVSTRGEFRIALSGGHSPSTLFKALIERDIPWENVRVFQVDERVAPDGHIDRNATDLRTQLLEHVPIAPANVHWLDVTASDLAAAAAEYAHIVRAHDPLDIVHLGLGDDGHTASWPPGDAVVEIVDRDVAVVGPYRDRVRLTITPAVVDRARQTLFLVTGSEKAAALAGLMRGDRTLPASRVSPARALIFTDVAALAG